MRRRVAILVLAGCGRVGFDASAPVAIDAPSTGCVWSPGFSMTAPERIVELASPDNDAEPFLLRDGLHLYFSSERAGGEGSFDMYLATRASTAMAFGPPVNLADVNTMSQETHLAIPGDGASAWSSSNAGTGDADLFRWTRTGLSSFSAMIREDVLSSPIANDYDPWVSEDALRIYYMRADEGSGQILLAARASTNQEWSAPQPIAELHAPPFTDGNPALTADERLIVWVSDRPGIGASDLWYATRPSIDATWDTPRLVPGVNTASDDLEAFVTGDGCELWLASNRPGGAGATDLYRARYVPP